MGGIYFLDAEQDAPGQTWDSGLYWDAGLLWDVVITPEVGDVTPYLDLITSEHRPQPLYVAMITATLQPIVNNLATLQRMVPLFDLDLASGAQLDIVGEWVGVSRVLTTPLVGVYFSFGTAGVGFGEGTWKGEFDPVSGLIILPDDTYRTLLRAKIANNQWDGTIPGAYRVFDQIFGDADTRVLIQDLGNMHMIFALIGTIPDAVTTALFSGGYLNLKPAGVQVDAYFTPSTPDTPYFGFGLANPSISGFGAGAWATR